jgi:hypothetical protein
MLGIDPGVSRNLPFDFAVHLTQVAEVAQPGVVALYH